MGDRAARRRGRRRPAGASRPPRTCSSAGLEPLVLEAGPVPAHAVTEWGHVRLFSRWPEAGRRGWPHGCSRRPAGRASGDGCPTGAEWVDGYLRPLAEALGERVRCGTTVTGMSRRGRDRLVDAGRAEQPFSVHVVDVDGTESTVHARAASSTWAPAASPGRPAPTGWARGRRAGSQPTGSPTGCPTCGPSAPRATPAATSSWSAAATPRSPRCTSSRSWPAPRRAPVSPGCCAGRSAPQRTAGGAGLTSCRSGAGRSGLARPAGRRRGPGARPGERLRGRERVERRRRPGVVLVAEDGRSLPPADRVVVLTGFRPDLSFLSELRLELDPTLQARVRLAAIPTRTCTPAAASPPPVRPTWRSPT